MFREKQLASGAVMQPSQGPKKKFEQASEAQMADYCHFCWEIGIPKTQEHFLHELVHYMEYYGVDNKFKNKMPGTIFIVQWMIHEKAHCLLTCNYMFSFLIYPKGAGWLRRFRTENRGINFLRKGQEDKYKKDKISVDQWAYDNERNIRQNNNRYCCWLEHNIFVVETQKLVSQQQDRLQFTVVVSDRLQILEDSFVNYHLYIWIRESVWSGLLPL